MLQPKLAAISELYAAILKSLYQEKECVSLNAAGIKVPQCLCHCVYAWYAFSQCLHVKLNNLVLLNPLHELLFHWHLQNQNLARATIFSLADLQSLWIQLQIARLVSFICCASSLKKLFTAPCWLTLKAFFFFKWKEETMKSQESIQSSYWS